MVALPTVRNEQRPAGPPATAPAPADGTPAPAGRPDLGGAIDLYRYLVRHGPVDVERLPGAAAGNEVRTLCELGLARTTGRRLVAVPPTAAVAHVLAVRQREQAVRQDALRRAYRDLIRLHEVLDSMEPGGGAARQVLTTGEREEISDRLRRTARQELLDVRTASAALSATPAGASPASGPPHRMILDRSVGHSPRGEQAVLALGTGGAVRLATGVTACLRIADGEHVLVWPLRCGYDGAPDSVADDTGTGATYFHSPAVAAAARGLFEVLWSGASQPCPVRPAGLTAAQWRILRLMTSGRSDAELAAVSGATVKTVRSHITAILLVLGVPTRFAAGVEAARRGWL